jgi:hypothetical protein
MFSWFLFFLVAGVVLVFLIFTHVFAYNYGKLKGVNLINRESLQNDFDGANEVITVASYDNCICVSKHTSFTDRGVGDEN